MQEQGDCELSHEHSLEDSEDYTSSSGSDSCESSNEDDPPPQGVPGQNARTLLALANSDHTADFPPSSIVLPSSSGRTGQLPPSSLSARLANFLPSLRRANDDLQADESASRNVEVADDEDEPHVDMNLGLGVLEEVNDGDSEDSDDEESQEESGGSNSGGDASPGGKRKADALGDMMGRKKKAKPSIEVVSGKEPESTSG